MAFARLEHAGGAAITTLSSDISSGATALTLVSSTNWPSGSVGPFYLVIDPGLSGEEKILATARSTNSLTGLTRGVDGTSASAHTAGAVIKHIFTAVEADEANQAAHFTLGAVVAKGDWLLGTASQTLGKLTAGANDTVPYADSGQTTGVAWRQVTTASLADDSVTTAKIVDANVTADKLAADTADQTTIGGGTGDAYHIPPLAITTSLIQDGAVTSGKIAANTVDFDNLAATKGCRLAKSTDMAVPDATATAIIFGVEIRDVGGMHENVTHPTRITINTPGVYDVQGCGEFASNATGYRRLSIRLNGTDTIALVQTPAITTGVVTTLNVTAIAYPFAQNDYLELVAFQNSGGSLNVNNSGAFSPTFSANYVSA